VDAPDRRSRHGSPRCCCNARRGNRSIRIHVRFLDDWSIQAPRRRGGNDPSTAAIRRTGVPNAEATISRPSIPVKPPVHARQIHIDIFQFEHVPRVPGCAVLGVRTRRSRFSDCDADSPVGVRMKPGTLSTAAEISSSPVLRQRVRSLSPFLPWKGFRIKYLAKVRQKPQRRRVSLVLANFSVLERRCYVGSPNH